MDGRRLTIDRSIDPNLQVVLLLLIELTKRKRDELHRHLFDGQCEHIVLRVSDICYGNGTSYYAQIQLEITYLDCAGS